MALNVSTADASRPRRPPHRPFRLSIARIGQWAAPAWRLWTIAFLVGLCAPYTPGLVVLPAFLVGFLAWEFLARLATEEGVAFPSTIRFARLRAAGSWLTILQGSLIATFAVLSSILIRSEFQLPLLVLTGASIGSVMVFAWQRQNWSFLPGATTLLVSIAVGAWAIWIAQEPGLVGESPWFVWLQVFGRLLAAFLIAVLSDPSRRDGMLPSESPFAVLHKLLENSAFAALAAWLMVPMTLSVLGIEVPDAWTWAVPVMLAAGILGFTLLRVRWPLAHDRRWIARCRREGLSVAGPMPTGMVWSTALAPAVIMAPVASWTLWTIVAVVGIISALLAPAPIRKRRRTSVRRTVSEEVANPETDTL
ncbi:hypothetical protein Pan216_46250 [Planctomycetes bacterium Pan216]|uniref:Uncharacterized protein n=1 Tax=Kolteria novifilia TaxID=2527975 RepID=A0A518B9T8_9BACT|nr:hypothetical protein Pan216_46250 [Planctomycetes bacterium Pan216]